MSRASRMTIIRPMRGALFFIVGGLLIWFLLKPFIAWVDETELLPTLPDICQLLVAMLVFLAWILGLGMPPIGGFILLVALANAVLPHRKVFCPHCRKVLMIFFPPSPEGFGNCPYCKGKVTKNTLVVE